MIQKIVSRIYNNKKGFPPLYPHGVVFTSCENESSSTSGQ
jgi:hypothetical protein